VKKISYKTGGVKELVMDDDDDERGDGAEVK